MAITVEEVVQLCLNLVLRAQQAEARVAELEKLLSSMNKQPKMKKK